MRKFLFVASVFVLIIGCSRGLDRGLDGGKEEDALAIKGITVTFPDWAVTKAYSRTDLVTPEMNLGDKAAVIDEEGNVLCYTVVASDDSTAVLYNHEAELIDSARYRIQYPYPEVWEDEPFLISLGFGAYESTPSLDWMVSEWKEYNKENELHFDLERQNGVFIFDVVFPFDSCQIDQIRLSSDSCMFCIKGAFDCSGDVIVPAATLWTDEFLFPYRDTTWRVKGDNLALLLTVWPYDFSAANCTLDIYTEDNQFATAPVSLPALSRGEIKEYSISEFEVLSSVFEKKEVTDAVREGDDIVFSYVSPGNYYDTWK